jgi:hypothetical protein
MGISAASTIRVTTVTLSDDVFILKRDSSFFEGEFRSDGYEP